MLTKFLQLWDLKLGKPRLVLPAQVPLVPGAKAASRGGKMAVARPAVQPNLQRIVGYAQDAVVSDEEDPFGFDSSEDEDAVLDRWAWVGATAGGCILRGGLHCLECWEQQPHGQHATMHAAAKTPPPGRRRCCYSYCLQGDAEDAGDAAAEAQPGGQRLAGCGAWRALMEGVT